MNKRKMSILLSTFFTLAFTTAVSAADLTTTSTTSPTNTTNTLQTTQAVPVTAYTNSVYLVQSGDSLWKISQKFGTTVDSIISANKLSSSSIYVGQSLYVKKTVQAVNYKIQVGDNLWNMAQKYGTTMDTIIKSNMLASNVLMPGQIVTIPVNSTSIVSPVGIQITRAKTNSNFGDLYTWENARRLWTVDAVGTLKDLQTGITFNVKYYGGSNHSDVVPLTTADTANIKKIFPTWSWGAMKPMVLTFTQGGVKYQLAVSFTAMPHSTTNIYNNGVDGHFDMYFYNSTSHNTNQISPTHQANILKANGQ